TRPSPAVIKAGFVPEFGAMPTCARGDIGHPTIVVRQPHPDRRAVGRGILQRHVLDPEVHRQLCDKPGWHSSFSSVATCAIGRRRGVRRGGFSGGRFWRWIFKRSLFY